MYRLRTAAVVFLSLLALPATAAIRGTVIDGDGAPVPGARVSLFGFESSDARRARLLSAAPEPVPAASTQADAKGNFSFESPKTPGEIRVFMRGYSPVSVRVEADDDAGAIVLPRAEMKAGSVTSGGKPVANAVVAIAFDAEYVTRTDENGRYEAPDPKRAAAIVVVHPDFAIDEERWVRVMQSGTPASELHRTLTRGTERAGRVVAADGETPVAAASVTIDGWPLAKSGDDGTFAILHAPAKWSMLVARKDSWIGQRVFVAEGPLAVRMARGLIVSGRILDKKTKVPIQGAGVWFGARRFGFGGSDTGTSVISDAKGVYSVVLAPGTWMISTTHPAYGPEMSDLAGTAGQQISKDLSLEPLARVSGFVFDEEKRPVSAAMVRIDDAPRGIGGMRMMRGFDSAASAPDGRFSIRLNTEGEARLRAAKKGLPSSTSELLRLTPGERKSGVVITIPSGIEVAGRVIDRNGDPVSGVMVGVAETPPDVRMMQRVIIAGLSSSDEELVRTAKDGTFSVRVKEGTFDFTFRREGYAPRTVRGHVVSVSGAAPVEATLDPAVEISGRVVRDGMGVEGVNLFAFEPGFESSAVTTSDGGFTLTGLSAGTIRVGLRKEDDFIQEQRTLTAPGRDVVIELPAGGRVSGRVLEKGTRSPIATFQAGVSTSRGGGGMVMMAPPLLKSFTSEDGSFVLENVPLGSINLVASAPGYASGRLNLTLEQGKPLEGIEIELDTGVRLVGKVTGANGSPLADVTARLMPAPGRAFSTMDRRTSTDANGEYAFETLEAGEETIEFSHPKHLSTRKTVTLKGKETRQDAQLQAGLRVSGVVVTDSGAPVSEADVTARGGTSGDFTRSGTNGAFELESLEPGRFTVTASKAGFADGRVEDFDPSAGTPLRVVLRTGGTIHGHVSGLTEQEISYAMVEARGPRSTARAAVDSAGNYRIEGVETGTVRVVANVTSRGFSGAKSSPAQTVEMAAGGSQQVDLQFPSDTVIRGRVIRNGVPLGGAMVIFYPRTGSAQTTSSATADQQGDYSLSGLQQGDYNVRVMDVQRFSPYSTTYQVQGSATFDIEFSTASVRGRVVDSTSGEPVAEATVQFRATGGDADAAFMSTRTTASDVAGNFSLDDVSPGTYMVSGTKEGYAGTPTELRVGNSPVSGVEVSVAKTDGVRLRVIDARDNRPLRAYAVVYDAQGRVAHDTRMSMWMGNPEEIHLPLPAGSFTASIGSSGYATRSLSFSSPSTQTVTLSRGGTLILESKHSSRRRARLVDAAGRTYQYAMRPTGLFDLNPRPGQTTLEHVAAGNYTVVLLSDDESSVVDRVPVFVEEGGITKTEI